MLAARTVRFAVKDLGEGFLADLLGGGYHLLTFQLCCLPLDKVNHTVKALSSARHKYFEDSFRQARRDRAHHPEPIRHARTVHFRIFRLDGILDMVPFRA